MTMASLVGALLQSLVRRRGNSTKRGSDASSSGSVDYLGFGSLRKAKKGKAVNTAVGDGAGTDGGEQKDRPTGGTSGKTLKRKCKAAPAESDSKKRARKSGGGSGGDSFSKQQYEISTSEGVVAEAQRVLDLFKNGAGRDVSLKQIEVLRKSVLGRRSQALQKVYTERRDGDDAFSVCSLSNQGYEVMELLRQMDAKLEKVNVQYCLFRIMSSL